MSASKHPPVLTEMGTNTSSDSAVTLRTLQLFTSYNHLWGSLDICQQLMPPERLMLPPGPCYLQQCTPLDNTHCSQIIFPRQNLLSAIRKPRGEKKPIPTEQKDEKYFERRKRNNQAAKKSRDARRLREDQVAFRAMQLEHENAILTSENLTLREEIYTLKQLLLHLKLKKTADNLT